MSFVFKIIDKTQIHTIIPLVEKLNEYKISELVLKERFDKMINENYECAGIFDDNKLIGVSGLWYMTRHYAGLTMEVDHVFIDDGYRGQGLGEQFFKWIHNYAIQKGCNTVELNTYVQNHQSHKFYFSKDYKVLGYHFLKELNKK